MTPLVARKRSGRFGVRFGSHTFLPLGIHLSAAAVGEHSEKDNSVSKIHRPTEGPACSRKNSEQIRRQVHSPLLVSATHPDCFSVNCFVHRSEFDRITQGTRLTCGPRDCLAGVLECVML